MLNRSLTELPEELQGLRISKDGQDLIDSKTGAIVNAFGATRFDVAVHAIRGDFDPPKSVDNSERSSSLLIGALKQFPMEYMFNLVYRLNQTEDQQAARQSISADVRRKLERVCGCTVPEEACTMADRMNGKYVSVKAVASVQHADIIAKAYDELGQDPRVIMKF
ncbi:g1830 [Coccomyxa viridis]|uniref:G1830 protein n=1 Tax=Coccomyxa viridis TaxID=1274662 RepID=A0ABP1FIX3_9CHLO